jgi:GDPmannose 4,6-dehydratase
VKHSLKEFLEKTFEIVGLNAWDHVDADKSLLRPSDINTRVGDAAKAQKILGWKSKANLIELVKKLTSSAQNVNE